MPVKSKRKPEKFKWKKKRRDTPGRPPKTIPKGQYDEAGFFKAVRGWFTPKELSIFKPSVGRMKMLSEDWRESDGLYPEEAVQSVVNAVKASVISADYIQTCLGMKGSQYDNLIRYIKADAVKEDSILAAKGYAIVSYFRKRHEAGEDNKKHELTFEHFEDLVKIALWHRKAPLDKFQNSRQGPQRIKPPSEPPS